MTVNRRSLLAVGAGLGLGAGVGATLAQAGEAKPRTAAAAAPAPSPAPTTLKPDAVQDQTPALQAAIDTAAARDEPLMLPAGHFVVSDLRLRAGTRLIGAAGATTLRFAGGAAFITADKADGLRLEGLAFDGTFQPMNDSRGDGLINIANSRDVALVDLVVRNSAKTGLSLTASSGTITGCTVTAVLDAAIKCLDCKGLNVAGNTISDCGNNGILVWRSQVGEDGSTVTGNRIARVRNAAGGTGEYGNGINVFRAGSVMVSNNRIADCTYTAVRGNAASNIQIVGNSCERLGEVAIYAEFGYEGALIANNLIDSAATGISVTNFNEGGRLAVIQGNLIRNLFRREHEREDKRGEGIGVEADAAVTGNTIEGAPSVGIQIGWGPFMRNVAATGNVIRRAKVGISITSAPETGSCLIANNLIAEARDGAIRTMAFGTVSGPDLAREPAADPRIAVSGNMAV